MPQELWDQVSRDLGSLTLHDVAKEMEFNLDHKAQAHVNIWTKIFKDESWLSEACRLNVNPTLIGADIDLLVHETFVDKHAHVYLLVYDFYGDLTFDEFEASLKPTFTRDYCRKANITYLSPHITLEVLSTEGYLKDEDGDYARTVFSGFDNDYPLQTKYCSWYDPERELKYTKPRGIGGEINVFDDLFPVWLLELSFPGQIRLQLIFNSFIELSIHGDIITTEYEEEEGQKFIHQFRFRPDIEARVGEIVDWRYLAAYPHQLEMACVTGEWADEVRAIRKKEAYGQDG